MKRVFLTADIDSYFLYLELRKLGITKLFKHEFD